MATKTITYLQAEGDANERFAARGAHNLLLEGEALPDGVAGLVGAALGRGLCPNGQPSLQTPPTHRRLPIGASARAGRATRAGGRRWP